jgi:hypothetical protein
MEADIPCTGLSFREHTALSCDIPPHELTETAMAFDPSSLLDVSHIATFLGGAVVGCAGQYLADRFTDQRRRQESQSASKKQFSRLKGEMPKLIDEMSQDLSNDESNSIREFAVTANKRISFNGDKPRFMYHKDEHPNIQLQVDKLLAAGYLDDVTPGNTPIYRMREGFVELIKAHA